MEYTINKEPLSVAIFFIKYLCINLGAYYIFLRLSNQKNNVNHNLIATIEIIAITYYYTIMRVKNAPFDTTILLIIFMTIIFTQVSRKPIGATIILTIGSLTISFVMFFIATIFLINFSFFFTVRFFHKVISFNTYIVYIIPI